MVVGATAGVALGYFIYKKCQRDSIGMIYRLEEV